MSEIKAGSIEKGTFLLLRNAPHYVAEREFYTPGKGTAIVRLKVKNLLTAQMLSETIPTAQTVETCEVDEKTVQFMYHDDETFHFMDALSFEQIEVPAASFSDKRHYLKDGDTYSVVEWNNRVINLNIPPKMVFLIAEAEDAVKGNTVQGVMKNAVTDTGLEVKVPIFIKAGEKIMVNTESGEYVERINK